jgi:hypothetical protein
VTPALALALLERNARNRPIAQERVDLYAKDMAMGAWHLNNQGIGLGEDGELFDGQHRLHAVVRAGATVRMLVVRGLPPAARATIDQGRSRSVGDALRMLDGELLGPRFAAWFRAIEGLTSKGHATVSHATVQRQIERYRPTLDWFVAHGPKTRPYARSPIVGALVYAHHVAADVVEDFTRGYTSGAGLLEGSPALALRSYAVERMHSRREADRTISLKTLRCVLAHIRGEHIERIMPTEEGFENFRGLHDRAGAG